MRNIFLTVLLLFSSFVLAAESKLANGTFEGFDRSKGGAMMIDRKPFYLSGDYLLEYQGKRVDRSMLLKGMNVSIFSEDSSRVSRIVIHGPYSLMQQASQH